MSLSTGSILRHFHLGLCLSVLWGLSAPLHGSTILNENFNELTPALGATSVGAFSAINGTNVDILGTGTYGQFCFSPEGGNCVDMDGTGGDPQGQLESTMVFSPGTYLLSFDLIGSQRGNAATTTVTFGNYTQTFVLASTDDSTGVVVNQSVTLTSAGQLSFASDTPGVSGDLLDNVSVSTAATTAPEPSSLLLIAFTLLAGMLVAGRRLRTAAGR